MKAAVGRRLAGRETFFSLYLPAFILALGIGIVSPALPVYAKSFDISFGLASLVIIMYQAGSLVCTLPSGYLLDRVGRRQVSLAGPLLTAAASLLAAQAHGFPELLVYRFIGGAAVSMWQLARLTIITDTGGGRRARQITGMVGMDSAGRLMGPAIGGFVADGWGLRAPFVVHAGLALLAVLASLLVERAPAARRLPGAADGNPRRVPLLELITLTTAVLFLAQFMANLTRGSLFGGTLQFYAAYAYGIGPGLLGWLAVITGAVGIPITFSAGYLMDRFGRRATMIPGQALLGITLALLAVTAYLGSPFLVFVGGMVLVQIAQSLTSGSMQTLGSDVAPAHGRGQFLGLWRLMAEAGTLLSPSVFALLAETAGYGASFSFLSIAGFLTAILIATQVRETRVRVPGSAVPPAATPPVPTGGRES